MKIRMVFCICAIVLFTFVFLREVGSEEVVWRSADPCNMWEKWREGKDHLITPALREGMASHALSPAQIFYLSFDPENGVNPVLGIAIAEELQGLVSIPAGATDYFESRLFFSLGFAVYDGETRYGGFFPQVVAAAFELQLFYQRGWKLEDVYEKYFPGGNFKKLKLIYAWYAKEFSKLTGVWHGTSLDGPDVFVDFRGREMSARVIQKFFEVHNSPLKDRRLFRKAPIDDSIDYANPFCSN